MMARPPPTSKRWRYLELTLKIGVPIAIFGVVAAVFFSEGAAIEHELSIIAPQAAAPGEDVPIRALVFDRVEDLDGGSLASAPVEARLVDRGGRVVARTTLRASPAGGADGSLHMPSSARGWIALEAIARRDGEVVATVRTSIEARRDPPRDPIAARSAGRLQHFEPGEVEILAGDPPSPFDVRVAGGTCVPEARCEILIHVGTPPAAVRIAPSNAITLEPASDRSETNGLVSIPLTVHGPEASVDLIVSRAGVDVAKRNLRLPVALATPAIETSARVLARASDLQLHLEVLGDRPGAILDVYRDERWARTLSFRPRERARIAPLLAPGLQRLQVHTDPYSAERSAVRMVAIRREGESVEDAVDRALGELAQIEGAIGGAPAGPPDLRIAWAAATVEDGIRLLPEAVSGYTEDAARLEENQRALRFAALVAIVLGLAAIAILFVRRGVDAALEAQRVMDATGDPELASARHRRRTLLSALLLVATVLLAFALAATIVVLRARLLE
jgi:hypothetical protein